MLKFAYAFTVSKRGVVQDITLTRAADGVHLTAKLQKNAAAEKYQAERHKKHLERVIKEDIHIYYNEEGLNK